MRLSSGISPLAGDEGRADVISDKFLIAFQCGPGLLFCISRPFHTRDTVRRRREREERAEINLLCSSLIEYSFSSLVWFHTWIPQSLKEYPWFPRFSTGSFQRDIGIVNFEFFSSGSLFENNWKSIDSMFRFEIRKQAV